MRSQVKIREAVREQDPDILVETLFRETAFIWPREQTRQQVEKWGEGQLCVVVSTFNGAEALPSVVTSIHKAVPEAHIVVVNNASLDATEAVALALGVAVLTLPIHLGRGGAVQTGLKYAVRYGFEFVVQVEAAGAYDFEQIADLMKVLDEGEADMVIGSRLARRSDFLLPFPRRFGIQILSWLIGIATDRWIDDSASRFRGYNSEALEFLAGMNQSDFPEPETVAMLLRNDFVVKEIPLKRWREEQLLAELDNSFMAWYTAVAASMAVLVSGLKRRER